MANWWRIFSRESRFALGQNLGEDECRSSWRDYLGWLDTHRTIGVEEILDTARRVFDERRRTVGYLRPETGAMGTLAETGGADGGVAKGAAGDAAGHEPREEAP